MFTKKGLRMHLMAAKLMFTSHFEERKVGEYLINLINSTLLTDSASLRLFVVAQTMLGKKAVFDMIKKECPGLLKREKDRDEVEDEDEEIAADIPPHVLKRLLRERIAALILKKTEKLPACHDPELEQRFLSLQKTFCLRDEEVEILSFFYLQETSRIVAAHLSDIVDFTSISAFRSYGNILLGLERKAFLNALAAGNLFKADIIQREDDSFGLQSWCADYLCGMSDIDLNCSFFTKENKENLQISDFDISEDDLLVLDALLKSKGRQNILLYGAAGSGKTSFARSLTKAYGRELLTVKAPEDDEHKDRLSALFATVNLADMENSVVLADEADEILNSHNSLFFESKTNKSWVNRFLESHDKKVIWITNRSEGIDPSTMRRFSFSMEFKKLNKKNRLKVLKYEIEKKDIKGFFNDAELNDLCKTYDVDAGGIVNAISTLQIAGGTDKEAALKKVRAVLKSHEKATGGNRGGNQKEREFDSYSIDGLNTSLNLKDIVSALQGYDAQSHTKNLSVAMLLYGMPGTGKSEFVYYLGNVLKKEVLLERASDIQSMWVGQTEKNIADAFAEAQGTNSILFFDEADTFLFPRKSALRSWEISFTNEILTQLESYKGIVAFATNDMEGLDHASLRRFKFKVEFRPLTSEGNLRLYNSLLKKLPKGELSEQEISALKGIKNLTPGDFAVVKDQMSFIEPSAITHKMLIEALANEVRYKKALKGIGF